MAKNDTQLNEWNATWRSSPHYAEILASIGVDPSKPVKLSTEQRKAVQQKLEEMAGQKFDKGLEIDPAGNMNQNEGVGKQLKKWGPLAAGIGLTLFGIPGVMPGVLSMGGAAAGAAGTAAAAGGGGAATGAVATAAGATAGKSLLDRFLGAVTGNIPGIVGAAGRMISGGAEAAAQNRGTEIDATMAANALNQNAQQQWFQQMLAREGEGRTSRNDSWKALQQGDYTQNWKPSTTSFSPYTRTLDAPSDALREAAGARATDARTRLTGNPLAAPERMDYTLDPNLLKGSMWEKLGGYAGAGMEAIGALRPPVSSTMPVGRPRPTVTPVDYSVGAVMDPNVWKNIRF